MIHAKFCKPRIFSWNSERQPEQIDRVQDFNGDWAGNIEKQYEIGRDGILSSKKGRPSFTLSLRQFEFGTMNFWYSLANMETPGSGEDKDINLNDIKTTKCDIAAFLTDDNDTFRGTIWFPKLRVNGFTLNIASPDAIVERNFDLICEDYKMLDGKYLAYQDATAAGASLAMVLSPAPVEYASGDYILRVLRVRSGVVSELVETTDYTYVHGTTTLTVTGCVVGDFVKAYYVSSTAYDTLWTDNDADSDFLLAESCEIRLKVGVSTRIYNLQSVGIDGKFDRTDYSEIGNSEVTQTGVKSKTVTVALDRYAENFSLEDILAGDTTYPLIDPRNYSDNIQLQVKIFSDKTHTSFKMGCLITNLTPTAQGFSQAVEDYHKRTTSLESDNAKFSTEESEIAFA